MTPQTIATRLLYSCGFSRQEYWSGLPCPPPGGLPNPGIEPGSPTGFFTLQATRKESVSQSVQSLSLTLCNPMDCSMPGFPVHHQLLEFTQTMSTELVMPSNHLILCHLLLLLPSIFPSIRVFLNESDLHIRWPKYWKFQLQHQSFQ